MLLLYMCTLDCILLRNLSSNHSASVTYLHWNTVFRYF